MKGSYTVNGRINFNKQCLTNINVDHENFLFEELYENLQIRLQSCVQPSFLITIFHQKLSVYFPICGLIFYGKKHFITPSKTVFSTSCQNLELTIEVPEIGRLHFNLKSELSKKEKIYICKLTQVLIESLNRALHYENNKEGIHNNHLSTEINNTQLAWGFQNSVRKNIIHNRDFSLLKLYLKGFATENNSLDAQKYNLGLCEFSKTLCACLRKQDKIFRYSSNEFIIIINDVVDTSDLNVIKRVKKSLKNNPLLIKLNLSCDIESAHYQKQKKSQQQLVNSKEQTLYRGENKSNNYINVVEYFA